MIFRTPLREDIDKWLNVVSIIATLILASILFQNYHDMYYKLTKCNHQLEHAKDAKYSRLGWIKH